jgi:RNA polymerase sigma-70 factor, ECF subfamily
MIDSPDVPPPATSDLAALFRAHAGVPLGLDDAALEEALRRLHAEGQRAWPGLGLGIETFVVHLAERAHGDLPPEARGPDLYLVCACTTRVRGAVEAFTRLHLTGLGAHLSRLRPTPVFLDEVRQEVCDKLFVGKGGAPPKIAEYDGSGGLSSWVRVVALRAAVDLRRKPGAVAEPSAAADLPAQDDPEAEVRLEQYRRAFDESVRGAIAALDPDHRRILRSYFADNVTLDTLAAELGVHRATVARRLASARSALRWEARRRLQILLGADESELSSLARMLRSHLAVSLPSVLLRE